MMYYVQTHVCTRWCFIVYYDLLHIMSYTCITIIRASQYVSREKYTGAFFNKLYLIHTFILALQKTRKCLKIGRLRARIE